jgi:DNA-binding CsgD family transcriptional regulator
MEASLLAGDMQRVALCLNEYAWGAWDAGDTAVALGRWDECVGLLRELSERAFLGSYLLIRGFARIRAGDPDAARGDVIEGAELTGQVGAIPDVITALAHAADWLASVGHRDRAVAHLVAADQIRSDHGIELDRVFPMAVVLHDLGMSAVDVARLRKATLSHSSPEDALNDAVRDLGSATILSSRVGGGPDPSPDALTAREREVLALVVAGRSNTEIADELFISRKTASVHVANIKGKFGAASRVEIATMALERGLVALGASAPDDT